MTYEKTTQDYVPRDERQAVYTIIDVFTRSVAGCQW